MDVDVDDMVGIGVTVVVMDVVVTDNSSVTGVTATGCTGVTGAVLPSRTSSVLLEAGIKSKLFPKKAFT